MVWQNGLQYDSSGNLITSQAHSAPMTWQNGLQFDANGALYTTPNLPANPHWQSGKAFDDNGAYYLSTAIPTVGGVALESAGTGIYTGYTLSTGDDFLTLDLVSAANPRGKYFTSRTYQGGGGCRAPATGGLAIQYDTSPDHTGWQDSNRGVPIASLANSHQIVTGEGTGALRLLAIRQTAGEQTLLNTGVAGQIERAAMVSGVSAFWWDSPAIIEWRASMPAGPHGQHPDMWGLSSNPPNGPNFTGNEYGWECGNTKVAAYHNDWAGGVLTGDSTDIAAYRDGAYHTFTVVLSATNTKWYVDGTLLKTYSTNTPDSHGNLADHMLITHHILNQTWQSQTYVASEWDLANAPNGVVMDIEWFRVWRQTGATHYKPLTTIADVQVTAGGALSTVLPSQTTLWGTTGLTEYVTCVQNEVEEPGSSNTVSYAQFPTGISYNSGSRTLSGTMPAQSGALYVVIGVKGDGNTCQPARFRIVAAPRYTGTGFYYAVKNSAFSKDVYAEWDVGRLFQSTTNPKGLTVSGLPTGLSFDATTGLITGTPTASSTGTIVLSATNSAGQTTSQNVTYLIADPALGAAAPTLTGSPALIASWDFDQAVTVTSSGGAIDSILGMDGTSVTLTGSGGTRPALTARTGKNTADFTAASSQVLQAANGLGLGTSGCTIVVITEPKATNLAATVVEVSQASAISTVNRNAVGTGTSTTGWGMRKCGASGGNQDANQGSAYAAAIALVIGLSKSGTSGSQLTLNGTSTPITSAGSVANSTANNITLLGCRSVSSALGNFYGGYIWRVLIYPSQLSATNLEEIATWAATNYGTQNLA